MDGHDYEYVVAQYLRGLGYTGTRVTKGSGDFGVDVLANKGSHKYAVQCKYYTGSVGVSAVQEAVAGKAYYGCDMAMVVTNSTFTKAARELAVANNVILLDGVESTKRALTLPTKSKLFFVAVYLFVASAAIAAALKATQGLPLWKAICNIVPVVILIAAPFWIPIVFRYLWRLLREAVTEHRVQKVTQNAVAPVQTVVSNSTLVKSAPNANADALVLSLEQDFGSQSRWIAEQLIGIDRISVSVIQRRCKLGYSRATQLLEILVQAGLVNTLTDNQYEWSAKAKAPSHK